MHLMVLRDANLLQRCSNLLCTQVTPDLWVCEALSCTGSVLSNHPLTKMAMTLANVHFDYQGQSRRASFHKCCYLLALGRDSKIWDCPLAAGCRWTWLCRDIESRWLVAMSRRNSHQHDKDAHTNGCHSQAPCRIINRTWKVIWFYISFTTDHKI